MGYTAQLLLAPEATWPHHVARVQQAVHAADCWSVVSGVVAMPTVRSLLQFAAQLPVGEYSVAVLGIPATASIEVQHALLKLVEEPPAHLRLYIAVEHERIILPTLRSRLLGGVGDRSDEGGWVAESLESRNYANPAHREEMYALLYRQPLYASKGVQQQLQRAQFANNES
jgi:hypothetical protein